MRRASSFSRNHPSRPNRSYDTLTRRGTHREREEGGLIRIDRVYTRTGDKGTTGLIGGTRVSKTARRIEAYGTVDELNAAIGMARAVNADRGPLPVRRQIETHLSRIQNTLFDVGSVLAAPGGKTSGPLPVTSKDVALLERAMDRRQKDLPPLCSFVLPGGGLLTATLHLARTICRRAEREVLRLAAKEATPEIVAVYLNRLSDFLFVLSRWVAKSAGEPELLWALPLKKRRVRK